jgi:hypothetical protein
LFSADAFVLGRIDEILSWEKSKEQEKDVRFVELGEYLCEVRAKQYWRLENLKSFDEFLEKRFAESRRKAYYLMAIHANGRDVASQSTKGRGGAHVVRIHQEATHELGLCVSAHPRTFGQAAPISCLLWD